jgi:predicted GNAT family acetyltransferase
MAPTVRDNASRSRYELVDDDRVIGIADYVVQGDTIVIPHTEIERPLQGRGLGEVLVRGTLDDIRSRRLAVVPQCWFVAKFIDEQPEYRDLLAG